MALTEKQVAFRENRVTASFAPYLMKGDETKILNEWRRIVGDPNYVPDDLSNNWAVQFGVYIESFAIDWHERKTGQALTERGLSISHPDKPYIGATLDCFRDSDRTVIDCKAPGMWRKVDDVLAQYPAQLVIQRGCMNANKQSLLVVHGGSEPVEHPIETTPEYEAEVWTRMDFFWQCVESLQPPVALPAVAAPIPVAKLRKLDMSGSNSWTEQATHWLANKEAAKTFEAAAKELKALGEQDVGEATGAGIVCKRNAAGSLSITKTKEGK